MTNRRHLLLQVPSPQQPLLPARTLATNRNRNNIITGNTCTDFKIMHRTHELINTIIFVVCTLRLLL